MDGKGSYNDNLFIERLWRTVKYEEVHLKAYQDGRDARIGLGNYFCFSTPSALTRPWATDTGRGVYFNPGGCHQ